MKCDSCGKCSLDVEEDKLLTFQITVTVKDEVESATVEAFLDNLLRTEEYRKGVGSVALEVNGFNSVDFND